MKIKSIASIVLLGVTALSLSACFPEKSESLAKVGSAKISTSDIEARIQTFPPESQAFFTDPANRQRLLDQLIDEEILFQYAKSQKVHQNEAVREQIKETREQVKQQGKMLERRVILAALVDQNIDQKVTVSEEQVRAYFDDNQSKFGKVEERKLSHILVSDEQTAKSLRSQIRKGASFETVAKNHSLDSTKTKGGDLGWVTADMLVPEFSEVAFALKTKNQVSGVVRSPFGFHIIKYKGSKIRPAQKFDDVKEQIYNTLYTTQREALFQNVLKDAKDTIKVRRDTPESSQVQAPQAAPQS